MLTLVSPHELRRISRTDYHRMAELGILAADEQVELLAGQIVQKMPKGPRHSALCKCLEKQLERLLGDQVLVRVQDPIQLDPDSEPEPDLAVVQPDRHFYAAGHPTPEQIYLIIEVADTTIARDLGVKAQLYAAAGIKDYWVVNVATQQLHIFREPQADGYQEQLILKTPTEIAPLAFPDQAVQLQDCWGIGTEPTQA